MTMHYRDSQDELHVSVDYYPSDGAQVIVSRWDDDANDFVCRYNSRIIADDLYETVSTALAKSGVCHDLDIDALLAEWDIVPSDYDCECDDCTDN